MTIPAARAYLEVTIGADPLSDAEHIGDILGKGLIAWSETDWLLKPHARGCHALLIIDDAAMDPNALVERLAFMRSIGLLGPYSLTFKRGERFEHIHAGKDSAFFGTETVS